MIDYFDVFHMKYLDEINAQLKKLDISTLDVVNIETTETKTRVWYRKKNEETR